MRRLISAALVAALMAPAVAQAQQHQHGQPQAQGQKKEMGQHQMGGMQGGMQMGGGLPGPLRSLVPYAPDNVLKMKEMLELSADQEKQLTALSAWAKQAGDEAHTPAEAAMQSLRTEMGKPQPSKESLQSFLVAHATAMGNMATRVSGRSPASRRTPPSSTTPSRAARPTTRPFARSAPAARRAKNSSSSWRSKIWDAPPISFVRCTSARVVWTAGSRSRSRRCSRTIRPARSPRPRSCTRARGG